MNADQQNDQPANNQIQTQQYEQLEARQQRIDERRSRRSGGSWIVGAVLVLIGILLIFQNLTSFTLNNWWALFILIPAFGAFGNAWRAYQNSGQLSGSVRASLFSGLILTLVAATFLFELSWTILGPILLILVGIGLLVNAILPGSNAS